jgi:hypothetical protein
MTPARMIRGPRVRRVSGLWRSSRAAVPLGKGDRPDADVRLPRTVGAGCFGVDEVDWSPAAITLLTQAGQICGSSLAMASLG